MLFFFIKGLGFSCIISPTNRPFRVIKGSPRDECDPVESQILPEGKLRMSNAFKNLESSFLKPETVSRLFFLVKFKAMILFISRPNHPKTKNFPKKNFWPY